MSKETGSSKAGLKINYSKTKILTNGMTKEVTIKKYKIEYIQDFVYLGQIVCLKLKEL